MHYLSRVTLAFFTLFLLGGCGYNTLQVLEEGVFKAWADVESTLSGGAISFRTWLRR